MSTEKEPLTRPEYLHGWYEKNKSELSEKRKRRYKEDLEYREAVKKRAAHRRKAGGPVEGQSKYFSVKGSRVIGYNIRHVANKAGVSIPAIVANEIRGTIPRPTLPGTHRFYTKKQVAKILKYMKWSRSERAKKAKSLFEEW